MSLQFFVGFPALIVAHNYPVRRGCPRTLKFMVYFALHFIEYDQTILVLYPQRLIYRE